MWLLTLNANDAFSPQVRTNGLSAESFPIATLSCGKFGKRIRMESRFASISADCLSSSVILSPKARVSAFLASASDAFFWPIKTPISFETRLRWALSCSTSLRIFLRCSSSCRTSSILPSSPAPRVPRRSRTESGRSRISLMSNIGVWSGCYSKSYTTHFVQFGLNAFSTNSTCNGCVW